MEFGKNFSEAKKNFLKPLVLASSLVLGSPSESISSEISDNCQKISQILDYEKKIDDLIYPKFENVKQEKLKKFENFKNNFCEKPVGVGFDQDLEKISDNLGNFENLYEEISESVNNLSEEDRFNLTFFKKSVKNFSEDEKKFFYEFLNIQKNFLADVENFSKNFSKEDFIFGYFLYQVNLGDSFFEIIKRTLNTEKADKVYKKISEINKGIKNGTLDKNKIIKRFYSYNKNKKITFLDTGDEIDFGYLVKKGILEPDPEFSKEILKKYGKGFLLEMYIKGNNFPLNLERKRMYNVTRGSFTAYCAGAMYQFASDVYSAEYPASYDPDLHGQSNAYKVIKQILKNGGEILDTGGKSIVLVGISEKNLEKYGNERDKKIVLKVANKDRLKYEENGWELEPNKKNEPYLKFSKYFKVKNLERKWGDLRRPIERIIQMEDGRRVGLEKKSPEKIKEKTVKIYEQAEKNPGSLIFWHYGLTGEIYKIIREHYHRHLEKNTLSEEEKKYPVAGYGSHYTFNSGRQTVDYSLYKLQNLRQKGENLPLKNVDTSQKITLKDAISTVIPGWDKEISDGFINKEEIFKKVKIFVKTQNGKYGTSLYDFWKNDPDLEEYILKKDDVLEVEDVYIFDEYLGQGRFIPLTKLLCEFEDNVKSNYTFANFTPTLIVKLPEKYREGVIPEYIKKIENTSGVQFAGIDSPQAFIVGEVNPKKIGQNIQRPFSVSEINKIYTYYNDHFAGKNGNEKAVWNKKTGKFTEGENLVFFLNGGKIKFAKQEKNFDELFERYLKEGIYQKSDKIRVKYFLEKIGVKEVKYGKINGTVKFPIFKFTGSGKISEKLSLASNSDKFKLKNISEINKIGREKGIEFLENITEKDIENVKKVTTDSYEQSVLLSMRGFESGSGKIVSLLEKGASVVNSNLVGTIGDFQINLGDGVQIFKDFFSKENMLEKFKTNFNEKIFYNFHKKIKNGISDKNFKEEIKKFILDLENIGTKFLAGKIFLEEKQKNIYNQAKKYYGNEFYSEILEDSKFISYKDNLRDGSFDVYKGNYKKIFIMGQSYILNKILYGNENFPNSEIQQKIDKKFHEKILKAIEENSDIVKKLGIRYTRESIEKSLKGYRGGKYIYTDNLNRIFGGSGFKGDLFRKSMGDSEAENAFQILKKIYQAKFGQLPPMFMDEDFREHFKYNVEGKKYSPVDNIIGYTKAKIKGNNQDKEEFFRGRNIQKIQKMILEKK